ncbi:Retroviral aspartyl protease [Archaeoglobales archaeon]|nr:MAG: Retroviral aspartyl protease [Archaeoglobales archaeon]
MGYVKVKVRVSNIERPEKSKEIELIADTGAIYTIVKRETLEELGIKPIGRRRFKLANGDVIERDVGICRIDIGDVFTHSIVVFGEERDTEVLGVTTLEELGLQVDPVTGELRQTDLLLLGCF